MVQIGLPLMYCDERGKSHHALATKVHPAIDFLNLTNGLQGKQECVDLVYVNQDTGQLVHRHKVLEEVACLETQNDRFEVAE